MRKTLSTIICSIGIPALLGLGLFALSGTVAPSEAEARCYTKRYRYCTYRRGYRRCYYRTRRVCTRSRRCYWRRRRVRRRYCRTRIRYRYGRRYRYRRCYYRTYYKRYRVCR